MATMVHSDGAQCLLILLWARVATGGLCPSQNLVDMYDMANGSAPFNSYDATGAPLVDDCVNGVAAPTVNTASGYDDTTPVSDRDPRLAASILYNGVTSGTLPPPRPMSST